MVRLWSVATGESRAVLDGESLWLPNLAFSADGRRLCATGSDNHVRIWSMGDVFPGNPDRPER